MSTVKKLSIQGVRSFSPLDNKGQWIEFESPLTLILGVNGSGKTTVIEALKYAITSQFPPNSAKGAAFVNDPKLGSGHDALAKVVLEVVDSKGDRYITTRRVKSQIKNAKGDLTMKQLEATFKVMTIKGDVREMTNKCGEIKYEMCRAMGVSEAVLNHVIFCHQEDSCWPLDEGKKVKEKFDSIFNTQAYMKCLDAFTKEDKNLTHKIKGEKDLLQYVIDNRKVAMRKTRELDDKKIKLQEQNDRLREYDKEIKIIEKKLIEFQALEEDYAKKQSEVAEKRTTIIEIGKQMTELKNNIKEDFRGGITELREYIGKFRAECSEKENQSKQCERDLRTKDMEWKKLDVMRNGLLKEEGMFQQEENANKKRLQELDILMSEIVSAMKKIKSDSADASLSTSFSGYLDACDGDSGTLSYDAVFKTLSSAIRMKESEHQRVKEEFDKEESELQAAIDEIRANVASTEKERDMKRQQLVEGKKTYEDLRKRLQALDTSNETLALLDDDEEKYKEQIETIEKSGSLVKYESDIKTLGAEVKELESKISTISDTINVLVRDKSKTDQIAMLSRQKQQKLNEANEIMRRLEDDLAALLGEIPGDGLYKAVNAKLKTLTTELKEKKTELKKCEVALGISKSELRSVKSELAKMEPKLNAGKIKVSDVLEENDYTTVYSNLTELLEKTQSDCSYAESASFLYKKYLGRLNKKDCCPLCKRGFENKALTKKLMEEIETDITRMSQDLPKHKKEIETLKVRMKRVLDAKPVWDECQRLEKEVIPELKTKKTELEQKTQKNEDDIEEIGSTVAILETDYSLASKSISDVTLYEQCQKEIKKWDDQIEKLESSRDPEAKRCTTNLSEAQAEQRELRESVESKRSEKEKTEEKRNRTRNDLATLQEKKNKVQKDKLRITAELQNRDGLETQKKELEVSTKDLQVKINELTQALPTLKADISKSEKNKSACIKRKDNALDQVRNDKKSLEKQKDGIADLHKRVEEFERKKGKFADVQQRVSDCKEKLSLCEKQRKEINDQIDEIKQEISNQELKKRDLQDNLSYKVKIEEVSKLKVELKEKEEILSVAENRGVATEKRELSRKYSTLFAKFNEVSGSKRELTKSITSLEDELETAQFKNAESDYITKVAKKTAFEKAQKDIRRYMKALDVAIMQFHHKKMEKINKVLFEYWRRIYKGNDIDKIMIKTENEHDGVSSGAKGKVKATGSTRKTYNYRVVMCRRGVDIDMRGRCSAGQRVLASIIIRIALAESFGARCGIISLDEPTTNLDQRNINSLADALADLAEKMKSRKNFQLIIITHDQEFTQRLSAVDAVEKYWKIDRDKDGFSQITMVPKRGYGGGGATT